MLHAMCEFYHPLTKNPSRARLLYRVEKELRFVFFKFCACCPVDSWGLLSFVLSIGCFFVQTWVGWFRLRSSSTLLLPRGIRFLGLVYRTINAKLSSCSRKNLLIYEKVFCYLFFNKTILQNLAYARICNTF